jgi:CCR4-NOT transcriptional complex subunit CAF120
VAGVVLIHQPYQHNIPQGGYNPYAQQHAMMAAQMAYQQAMMSMSHAGSQAGGVASHYGHQSPDRPASPASMQGQGGGMSPSPSMGPYGNYFPPTSQSGFMPPWGGMGNMGMPWSPSPGPQMGGAPWLQPPGMMPSNGMGGGSDDGRDSRSRVHGMASESGQAQQQPGPIN